MPIVDSVAAFRRLPIGTRLRAHWPATGRTEERTLSRVRSKDAVFATPRGESFLPLVGATFAPTDDGFRLAWPADPGATAVEYTFA